MMDMDHRRIQHGVGMGLLIFLIWGCNAKKTYSVKTETIKVDSLEQIIPLSDALVKPILYTHVSGLSQLSVSESKSKFVAVVLPAILVAKIEITNLETRLNELEKKKRWKDQDSAFYLDFKKRYKAISLEDLLYRIGTLPNSIVLAQAAVESGWGQSRFFLEANNLFGIWSFKKDEPRVAAGVSRNEKTVYIRSYENISASILHYFEILGTASAYSSLREARHAETSPFALLPHLENYSERRSSYTELLKEIILQNHFTHYDQYRIDPDYMIRD